MYIQDNIDKTKTVILDILKSQGITLLTIISFGAVQYSNLNHVTLTMESVVAKVEKIEEVTNRIDVYDYRITANEKQIINNSIANKTAHQNLAAWIRRIDERSGERIIDNNPSSDLLEAKIEDTETIPQR